MRVTALLVPAALILATPVIGQDFWAHWGDGKAEVNGYRLTQPRYGAKRSGTAVYVFVTEDFSDSLRVKADAGRHPKSDVKPVMKLNAVRDFSTGIYDYNVMTSTFLRAKRGWPVSKVSFSSQEWCGHVWHQIIPREGRLDSVFHSYFDGEADGAESLEMPADGVFEDALPVILRGWNGAFVAEGETRTVPFLPSLLQARLTHTALQWTTARISRSSKTESVSVPAGRFDVSMLTVEVEGGRTLTFAIEARPPYRLVRQTGADGEELALLGSARLAYWKLNTPGAESYLAEIGLGSD